MKRDLILSLPQRLRAPLTIKSVGDWLQRRQDIVRGMQWGFVCIYYFFLFAPAILQQPASRAETLHSLAGWAEILFWGLWWPGVLLSMLLFGQFWCGVFCPDGMLTELVSRHGRGGKIPAWVRWAGWPLLAYCFVVIFESLANAYQNPRALLVTLGGASILALVCGYFFGRGKRVWCRYLCPVSSIFSLLARCAMFHYKVDRAAWDSAPKPLPRSIDCPPLLDVRRLRSNEKCSMCGRCSGHRNAVELSIRWPGSEIVTMAPEEIRAGDAFGICFVLIGLFHAVMQRDAMDVFTFLSVAGPAESLLKILLLAGLLGAGTALALLAAARGNPGNACHLAYALIPVAGLGLFSGALEHSFSLLAEAGFSVENLRRFIKYACMTVGMLWSISIAHRIIVVQYVKAWRLLALCQFVALAISLGFIL
jgi:polyferredoxin